MTTRSPAQGRRPAPRGRARGPLAGAARHDPRDRGPRLRLDLARRAPPLPLAGPAGPRALGGLDADGGHRGGHDRGSSSGRSSPAPTSTTRRCSRSRPRRSTRSAAAGSSSAWARAGTRPNSGRSASRTTIASTASRRRSRSSGRSCTTAPSTSTGASTRPATASCCRAGRASGGPPLLIGSNGPRMLRMTMPYADAWNTWFADIGNAARRASAALRDGRRRGVPRRRARPGRDRADGRGPRPAARRHRAAPGRLRAGRLPRRSRARPRWSPRAAGLRAGGHRARPARPGPHHARRRSGRSRRCSTELDRALTGRCASAGDIVRDARREPRASIRLAMRDSNRSPRGRRRSLALARHRLCAGIGVRWRRAVGFATPSDPRPDRHPQPGARPPDRAGSRGRRLPRPDKAGLRVDANTAGPGAKAASPSGASTRRIGDWPLIISEYSSAKALAKAKRGRPARSPARASRRSRSTASTSSSSGGRRPARPAEARRRQRDRVAAASLVAGHRPAALAAEDRARIVTDRGPEHRRSRAPSRRGVAGRHRPRR